jgi:hypothetical protein
VGWTEYKYIYIYIYGKAMNGLVRARGLDAVPAKA